MNEYGENENVEVEVTEEPQAKCWGVFRKVGHILGIVSLAGSLLCVGMFTGEAGIIFTILGKKKKGYIDKKDLTLNIVGFVVSVIMYIIYIVLFGVLIAAAAGEI